MRMTNDIWGDNSLESQVFSIKEFAQNFLAIQYTYNAEETIYV